MLHKSLPLSVLVENPEEEWYPVFRQRGHQRLDAQLVLVVVVVGLIPG